MSNITLLEILFTLTWESPYATHTEIYHLHDIDPLTDIFPMGFGAKVSSLAIDESCSDTFHCEELIEDTFASDKVIHIDAESFNENFKGKYSPPSLYRFYPKAIAYHALDTSEDDYTPFRLTFIDKDEDELMLDYNHPLIKYDLSLTAKKIREYESSNSKRRTKNIGEIITSKGPGMQVPYQSPNSEFFKNYPYKKTRNSDPIAHLNENAIKQIKAFYSEHIPKHGKVLDLLADRECYLEDDLQIGLLVGISKNEGSLIANQSLDTYNVQDLNEDPILPYEADSFDTVICTLSIDCLTDPLALMHEVSNVLKQGGKFIITFSDIPANHECMDIWHELHSFERMQLIIELFNDIGLFSEINTYSNRGLLRPKNDAYYPKKKISDPIYAVWGELV